ncbi:hypothetical protein PtA15_10A126 [Puccinia triticina]|uniref:Tet-like 2OG-Fe(II) oxygenase domain-containing protein n=1 Tax=Puccinia triticina TaxID=208348 RepID=A0ABY7D167_9BASI|nr:uncharacterized protein PtA15_10A126 [Puccinia triticina]WAQ88707.1 hypothetical protein PtA15_10A126 [Puccinia triticina]
MMDGNNGYINQRRINNRRRNQINDRFSEYVLTIDSTAGSQNPPPHPRPMGTPSPTSAPPTSVGQPNSTSNPTSIIGPGPPQVEAVRENHIPALASHRADIINTAPNNTTNHPDVLQVDANLVDMGPINTSNHLVPLPVEASLVETGINMANLPDPLPVEAAENPNEMEAANNPNKNRIIWSKRPFKPIELYPHMLGDDPDQKPTPEELVQAMEIAAQFHYFHHGKVILTDRREKSKIIAVIEFTPINELTPKEIAEINLVTSFLKATTEFINVVGSDSRSWFGRMWAIGWRKCMEAYELIGRYRNRQAIKKNPETYDRVMRSSATPCSILGQMLRRLANVVFEENRELMVQNSIPSVASLEFDTPLNEDDCAPNLTFTVDGFCNQPHKDNKDISEFAFGLFLPVLKENWHLSTLPLDPCYTQGSFVFPDQQCGLDLSRCNGIVKMVWRANEYRHCTLPATMRSTEMQVGISMQINERTAKTSRDTASGEIFQRPSNLKKPQNFLYVGGHQNLMPFLSPGTSH